jgi:hypothetical protein
VCVCVYVLEVWVLCLLGMVFDKMTFMADLVINRKVLFLLSLIWVMCYLYKPKPSLPSQKTKKFIVIDPSSSIFLDFHWIDFSPLSVQSAVFFVKCTFDFDWLIIKLIKRKKTSIQQKNLHTYLRCLRHTEIYYQEYCCVCCQIICEVV